MKLQKQACFFENQSNGLFENFNKLFLFQYVFKNLFKYQKYLFLLLLGLLLILQTACSSKSMRSYQKGFKYVRWNEKGAASWYGGQWNGRQTASGERFNMNDFTAAHKTLPFGSLVCVRNLDNDRIVRVRINDRGPYTSNRIIDLSQAAAKTINIVNLGVQKVELWTLPNQQDEC